MSSGSKAAKRGFKHEDIFVQLVNNNSRFNNSLKGYLGDVEKSLEAYRISDTRRKADIGLRFGDVEYGCSIKTAEVDFNQLDRRWLNDWSDKLNMPLSIHSKLEECVLNKMKHKRDKFILDKHKDAILGYFRGNMRALLKELFVRDEDKLKYLIICIFTEKGWYILKMTDVFDYIEGGPLSTTKAGILMFGDCLSMQRKSGNGKHVKIPKDNPAHPGNHIQFKIKPISLIRKMPENQVYKI